MKIKLSMQQCVKGREIAGLSQEHLHRASEVSLETIRRFEAGDFEPNQATLQALISTLEGALVEFTGGQAYRVRLEVMRGVTPHPRDTGSASKIQ